MARSPNYPSLSLSEAIERVKKVYRVESIHKAPKEVVAKALGYNSLNGASLAVIGALNRYGLLQADGDGLRISDDAVSIIDLPKGDPDRSAALKRVAFTPTLFAELWETYKNNLPSDINLRHYLTKKKFLPKAADDVIRVYRDNLELVTKEAGEYNADAAAGTAQTQTQEEETPMQQPQRPFAGRPSPEMQRLFASQTAAELSALGVSIPQPGQKELQFNISRNSQARVIFTGEVTQEAIEKLAALLELQKDTFPTQAELAQPRFAVWRNKDHDQPVTVLGDAGEQDGRRYKKIEGSDTGVPEDELEYT